MSLLKVGGAPCHPWNHSPCTCLCHLPFCHLHHHQDQGINEYQLSSNIKYHQKYHLSFKFHKVTSKVFPPQLSLLFLLTSDHIHHYPDQGLAQLGFYPKYQLFFSNIKCPAVSTLKYQRILLRSNFFTITLLKGA